MNTRADNPGVRVPPPLFYAAAVVAGWLANRRWPLPVGGGASRLIAAGLLVAAWAVLTASSIGLFRRKQTSLLPIRPATALVIAGPYKMTRNPRDCELIKLNDHDHTEAVHMKVLGKHSRGGKREEAYGMFGAVTALKP